MEKRADVRSGGRARGWSWVGGCALLMSVLGVAHAQGAGQVSVTDGGQASYSVPIPVPPGRGGIEPKLALQYTGGVTSGPFGHGWALAGLSVITRCGANEATDGVRRGVKYTADDKFCLDGQRLILTDAAGTPVTGQSGYGGAGTEYRFEKDDYSRIRAYGGSSTTGPQSFKMWTKAGLVYEYGVNADSRIEAQGKSAVMAWSVSKVSDTVGNFMTMSYYKASNSFAGSAGTEWAITQIRYTGNASQQPTSRVDFAYEGRSDASEAFHEGSKSVNTIRLAGVRTYTGTAADGSGGVKVSTLKMAYTTGGQTGRSLLAWTQSCGGAAETTCAPKTEYTYGAGPGFTFDQVATMTGVPLINGPGTVGVLQGDFNGDGRQDLIRWHDNPASNELMISNGDGSFSASLNFNIKGALLGHSNGCYYSVVADFNADGVADVLAVSDPYAPFPSGCGNGYSATLYLGSTSGAFSAGIAVNGPAMIKATPLYQYYCLNSDEGGCIGPETLILYREGRNYQLSDVNGDGFPDLIISNTEDRNPAWAGIWGGYAAIPKSCTERSCIYLGSGTSPGTFAKIGTTIANENTFSNPTSPSLKANYGNYKQDNAFVGDINGDGLPDIVDRSAGVRYMATGTLGVYTKLTGNLPSCGKGLDILDMNGDGKWDAACLNFASSASYTAWVNSGDGAFAFRSNVLGWHGGTTPICYDGDGATSWECPPADWDSYMIYIAADFDGDGISDIMSSRRKLENLQPNTGVYTEFAKGNRDGTFSAAATNIGAVQLNWQGLYSYLLGDFTGKGSQDILRMGVDANENILYRRTNTQPADMLVSVKTPTGAITTIAYKPLTDASVYTRLTGAVYPTIDLVSTQWVVSSVSGPNGVGGTLTTNYEYGGQRAHVLGRGHLGFKTLARTVPAANGTPVTTRTTYLQDWPYTGLPQETRKWPQASGSSSWVSLAESTYGDMHTLGCPQSVPAGTPRLYRPVVQSSTEQGRDLNLTPMATVTTTSTYNCYGDPTQVTVQTTGLVQGQSQSYTKATTNTYLAANTAADNWILGRLSRAEVTSTVPDLLLAGSTGSAPATFNGLSVSVSTANVVQSRTTPGILTANVTATATGGASAYTYAWTRLAGNTFTMSASAGVLTVSGNLTWNQTKTETFRVTVTDQAGTTRAQDVNVTYSVGAPPPLNATMSHTTIQGTRANPGVINITGGGVSASGGSGVYSYSWARIAGTRTSIPNPTSATPTFSASVGLGENFTETVRVTVTDSLGASVIRDMNVQFYTPAPVSLSFAGASYNGSFFPGTNTPDPVVGSTWESGGGGNYHRWLCARDNQAQYTFSLSVGGGTPPYSYSWSGSSYATLWAVNGASAVYRFSAAPLVYGSEPVMPFYVTVSDAAGNSVGFTGSVQLHYNGGGGCGFE